MNDSVSFEALSVQHVTMIYYSLRDILMLIYFNHIKSFSHINNIVEIQSY